MADDEKGSKKPEHGACPEGDVISVGPNLGGICPFVRHHADHSIETGLARIAEPGQIPTSANPLYLTHRQDNVFDVQTMSRGGSDVAPTKGPAKVNSPAYKDGWENIFGNKTPVGQA